MAIVVCKVDYSKSRSSSESVASEGDPSSTRPSISSETATRSGGISPAAPAALYRSTPSIKALSFLVFRDPRVNTRDASKHVNPRLASAS